MKTTQKTTVSLLVALATLLCVTQHAWAQTTPAQSEFLDVIETNEGNVWKGLIIEQIPDKTYKMALLGGSVMVIDAATVTRISKARNPDFRRSTRSAVAVADPALAEMWDVIETKTGSVWKGLVIEQIPGVSYRVALPGGSVMVIKADEVTRITKERNPNYGATSANANTLASSGLRLSVSPFLPVPLGDLSSNATAKPSFGVSTRAGYEILFGKFAVTPAFHAVWINWFNDASDYGNTIAWNFLHLGGQVRVAGHFGRVVPYLAVGAGVDLSFIDDSTIDAGVGFGMAVDVGLDVLVTKNFSIGLPISIHPGTAPVASFRGAEFIKTAFISFGLEATLYL